MTSGPVNAVVTTGIYCRDGCPASPQPGNVRTYPLDAAAEAAGFRPCLRCRPDLRPPPASWDTSQLVAHALSEICAGALDVADETALAAHCGVSTRHLVRLFKAQLGTTPTQVAISRRAHFARRLLDETDLPVAQIAFAAGFGSVRTMNEVMKRIFRFTPSALRAKRSQLRRDLTDGGLRLSVALTHPIDPRFLERVAELTIEGVEAVTDHSYVRTIEINGHPGVVELTPEGPQSVEVEAHLPRFDHLITLVDHIRHFLAQRATSPPGWTPTETALKAHLTATTGTDDARPLLERITQRHGHLLPSPLRGLTHLSADYEALTSADWTTLEPPGSVSSTSSVSVPELFT